MQSLLWMLCAMVSMATASKILMVVPVPSTSHVMLFEPLAMELGRKGHQVTYVAARKLPQSSPNVKEITIATEIKGPDGKVMDFLKVRNMTALDRMLDFPEIGLAVSEEMVVHPLFQSLLREKPKFDLLLQEAFVSEGLMAGLARYFQVPFIGYATFIPSSWTHYMVGNIAPTSFLPEPFTGNPYPMNFCQRMGNFLYAVTSELYHKLSYLPRQDALMRRHFGDNHPYVEDIIRNMSVLLINDHVSTSFPRPSVPNMVGIAGLHVAKPKPLPNDLQVYLDSSKKGAILFSLGSNIKAKLMSAEKIQMFLDVFAKLEENVLWKFEADLPNIPKNVKISKWLPQSDILAHPNIKLFITHGGLLSTTEAIDRGVPIVGIPFFGDQPINMALSVSAGVGLSLGYDQLNGEVLLEAIREVLDNPKYREATQRRSLRFHDRILPPLDLAVWWVEYVIRHEGAPHLRSGVQDLTWYQAHQLDVIAALVLAASIGIYIVKCMLKMFRNLITCRRVSENKKKN